ncbi:NADH-quinone oxidoreductase subunit 15 [Meiothermus sp.]|uniref:NADH-quinone oxidoreductase subunit 15 n=1 Tax=Meiothermus sp. TaxID=1955249 RepID=UPI0021DC1EA2|nr:NADH-quinone oxidoreductase subunit 15 [Meiothermus sp.]GIW26512.1 MAG: NADH-quinone oxidoreductase subunit 15 [Meiothermus sp.]
MSAAHDPHHDAMLYQAWVQVIEWMKAYAAEKGVLFSKESDFPDFIYRMERPYDLPTTMMAVSLSDERGEPFFFASVSPRHAKLKHVAFRVPGGHVHHHAHWEDGKGLMLEGKFPLTKEKLYQMADRARAALARA